MPNTAATNRMLAYLQYLSEQEIVSEVIFFTSDKYGSVMSPMPGIHIKNEWTNYLFKKGLFSYISILWALLKFRFRLKQGDIVYCYEYVNYWKLFLKKGVKVFAEYTENPDVIGLGGKFLYTSKKRFELLCKELTGLFVISSSLKEYFVKIGVNENRIHIINIIVDEKRFEGIEKDKGVEPYIAYCGSANNNKDGVDQLIKSFAIAHNEFPNLKLYIIGESPNKRHECSNVQLAKELGVEEFIIFTGLVPSESIPQLLKNAQLLVLDRPQNIQAQYGFPTKLGEYLLTCNPTVLTKVGDIPLFLEDKVSTVFAEPDNPEDFSNKMIWCLKNPEMSEVIGKNGLKVAKEHFSYNTETKKMVDVMFEHI